MKHLGIVAMVAVMTTGSAITQQVSDDQYLITPGVGIGPITVGMQISDAAKILGTPKPAMTKLTSIVLPIPDGAVAYKWPLANAPLNAPLNAVDDWGLVVVTDRAGVIFEVQSPFDSRYHTAKGLHAGSQGRDVVAALGVPSREFVSGISRVFIYDPLGIAIFVINDRKYTNYGLVANLWVFAPR